MTLVPRPRIQRVLARRHELALILLDAPGGSGRTVALDHALAHPTGSGDDVRVACTEADAQPGALAARIVAALAAPAPVPAADVPALATASGPGPAPVTPVPAGPVPGGDVEAGVSAVSAALAARAQERPVALILDQVERAGAGGGELLEALVSALPPDAHLVVSGRRLPALARARRVAAGTAVVLGPDVLALRGDEIQALARATGGSTPADRELAGWPAVARLLVTDHADLVVPYLHDLARASVEGGTLEALAVLAAIGGAEPEVAIQVLTAMGLDAALAPDPGTVPDDDRPAGPAALPAALVTELSRLPLVRAQREGIWPHPVWAGVAREVLSPERWARARAALARARLDQGALTEAGRIALDAGDADTLATVARAVLATLPPGAAPADLARWGDAPLLADRVEGRWLRAVAHSQVPGRSPDPALEDVRAELERAGDHDAELAVMLHLGGQARRDGDQATLGRLLARADVLDGAGVDAAHPLATLGRAIVHQWAGRYDEAIAELDGLEADVLQGNAGGEPVGESTQRARWRYPLGFLGAQILMVRGTNLLLSDRIDAALAAYEAATGMGTSWSRAVAHDLLSMAHWINGAPDRAIDDARLARDLARSAGTRATVEVTSATLACYLALAGDPDADDAVAALPPGPHGGETAEMVGIATAVDHINHGRLDAAWSILADLPPPLPTTRRATLARAALETALAPSGGTSPDPAWLGPTPLPAAAEAVAIGRAAARHLAGGPLLPAGARRCVPFTWCEGSTLVELRLLGTAAVRRAHRPVVHPAWRRGRVRELCLHLAVRPGATRREVATALWPELDDEAAGANLRVNLSHLMAVLDPGRSRGTRSPLLEDDPPLLGLADGPGVRVDVRDLVAATHRVQEAAVAGNQPTVLGAARRLLTFDEGPVLGGIEVGEWFAPVRRRLDEQVLRAVAAAGPVALAAGLPDLAEALGRRALGLDPWTESAHRLVIGARLLAGDSDGARRAALEAVRALDEVGGARDAETLHLAQRSGLRPPWPSARFDLS